MSDVKLDVTTIGNAMVDVLARVEDDFLTVQGLDKSIMHLVDRARSAELYGILTDTTQISGGSAANTAVGVASLGAKAGFIGKVANDDLGDVFEDEMDGLDIYYITKRLIKAAESPDTGRCMVLVTPDSERTLNTYLGAGTTLSEKDISEDMIIGSKVTYMEGYLWDPAEAKKAFIKAAHFAHKAENAAAITLSDPFCVERYRDEFLDLLRSQTIDYVFANVEEVKSLYDTDDFQTAVMAIAQDCELAVITMGADGAMAVKDGEIISVPCVAVDDIADLTGAGDLFASGFLASYVNGKELKECLQLGCLCASEVISHIGARPEIRLSGFAERSGFSL